MVRGRGEEGESEGGSEGDGDAGNNRFRPEISEGPAGICESKSAAIIPPPAAAKPFKKRRRAGEVMVLLFISRFSPPYPHFLVGINAHKFVHGILFPI